MSYSLCDSKIWMSVFNILCPYIWNIGDIETNCCLLMFKRLTLSLAVDFRIEISLLWLRKLDFSPQLLSFFYVFFFLKSNFLGGRNVFFDLLFFSFTSNSAFWWPYCTGVLWSSTWFYVWLDTHFILQLFYVRFLQFFKISICFSYFINCKSTILFLKMSCTIHSRLSAIFWSLLLSLSQNP